MDTQTIEGTLISEFTWTAGDAGTFLLLKKDAYGLPVQIIKLRMSDRKSGHMGGQSIGSVEWNIGTELTVAVDCTSAWATVLAYGVQPTLRYFDGTYLENLETGYDKTTDDLLQTETTVTDWRDGVSKSVQGGN